MNCFTAFSNISRRHPGQEVRTHSHRLVLPLTAINELSTVLQQFEAAVKKMRADQQGQAE